MPIVSPKFEIIPSAWCILNIEGHPGISPCIFSVDYDWRSYDWRRSSKVVKVEEDEEHYFVNTESGSFYRLKKERADVNLYHPVLEKIKELAPTTCSGNFEGSIIKK